MAFAATSAFSTAVASAAKRADLYAQKVSSPPGQLAAGRTFTVVDTVANKGAARAGSSKMGYYLSSDRRLDVRDVRLLGSRSVAPLRPRAARPGRQRVTVPKMARPGREYLLACADADLKVREANERNNCRASKGRARVKGPPGFPRRARPLSVEPVLDTTRAVTMSVGPFGGTIAATGADGTTFTLTVPEKALVGSQEITLTPVVSVGRLPLSKGLVGAVQIEPHGLQLKQPATLTIDPAREVPVGEQTGFLFEGDGSDFHLYPLGRERALTLRLMHFSTPGVGAGTDADRRAALDRMPVRTQAQYEQAISEVLRRERENQLGGGDPNTNAAINQVVLLSLGYYRDVVRPLVQRAFTDDAYAQQAISELVGWARQVELLGAGNDPEVRALLDRVFPDIERILRNAIDKSYKRCVKEHNLNNIARLVGLERAAQLLGINVPGALERALRCGRIELDFDSRITTKLDNPGQNQSHSGDGAFRVRADDLLFQVPNPLAQGPINWSEFSFFQTVRYHESGSQPCTQNMHTDTTGIGTTPGTLQAIIQLDLDPRAPQPGKPDPPNPDPEIGLFFPTAPKETYRTESFNCAPSTETFTEDRWHDHFQLLHNGNLGLPADRGRFGLTFRGFSGASGELLGRKTYSRTAGTTAGGNTLYTENTTIELWHRPE